MQLKTPCCVSLIELKRNFSCLDFEKRYERQVIGQVGLLEGGFLRKRSVNLLLGHKVEVYVNKTGWPQSKLDL